MSPLDGREYRVRTFGGPDLVGPTGVVPLQPLQRALLGILAFHGQRGIERSALFSLLWAVGSDFQVRRRFSTLKSALLKRSGLPNLIFEESSRVCLDVRVARPDLEDFHTHLQRGQLSQALVLLKRGFLPGINESLTHELERWVQLRRSRLRGDFRMTLLSTSASAERRGAWEGVEEAGRLALELDPADEAALQTLMRAQAIQGRCLEARAHFQSFREAAMREDPTWVPQPHTMEVLARLSSLEEKHSAKLSVGHPLAEDATPLVGRADELRELRQLLRHSGSSDHVPLILVTGEAGIGKTRLVREALRTLPFDGIRVLTGQCTELAQNIPLSPLLEALKADWVGETIHSLDHPWNPILLSFFPEFHVGSSPLPDIPPIPARQVPRRLCEAFLQLFRRLTQNDPVVLFLDDLDRADQTCLSVLQYICHGGTTGNLKVVGTHRQAVPAPEGRPSGTRLLYEDSSFRREIRLRPLPPEAIQELATAVNPDLEASSGTDLITSLSGGIPSHLISVARHLDRFLVRETESLIALPELSQLLLTEQIDQLSEVELEVLYLLAVARGALRIEQIDALLSHPSETVGGALDRLILAGLVRLGTEGPVLAYDLLRIFMRRRLASAQWVHLNRTIATLGEKTGLDAALLARFYFHGELFSEARDACQRAALAAGERGAFTEQAQSLKLALEAHPTKSEAIQIRAALAECLLLARDFPEAQKALRRSSFEFEAIGDQARSLRFRLMALDAEESIREGKELEADLDEVYRLALVHACPSVAADALDQLTRLKHRRLCSEEVLMCLDEAERLLPRAEGPSTRIRLLQVLAVGAHHHRYQRSARALRAATQAVGLARETNDEVLLLSSLNRLMTVLLTRGELATPVGAQVLKEAQDRAARSGDLFQRAHPPINYAVWMIDCGEYDTALRILEASQQMVEATADARLMAIFHCNRAIALLRQGKVFLASEAFAATTEFLDGAFGQELLCHVVAGLGWIALEQGEFREAKEREEWLREQVWPTDPTLVGGFILRFGRRSRRYEAAAERVGSCLRCLKGSFPVYWIDLVTQRQATVGPFLDREDWFADLEVAKGLCEALNLEKRRRDLDRYLCGS